MRPGRALLGRGAAPFSVGGGMIGVVTAFLILIALGLAVAVLALWLRLRQATQREALQALAARRGWGLSITGQRLGRPSFLRISPRAGHTWQVSVRGEAGEGLRLKNPPQSTEFAAVEPQWADGLLVIAPLLQDSAVLSHLDSPEGQALLARMLGDDMAGYAAVLRHYPGAEPITVLASADPAHRIDRGDVGKMFAAWNAQAPQSDTMAVMILGSDGFRLRLRTGIARADRMEAFIDLALDLVRIL